MVLKSPAISIATAYILGKYTIAHAAHVIAICNIDIILAGVVESKYTFLNIIGFNFLKTSSKL
ncbi:MAG: hypothetical protein ACTS7E_01690 [Arsenophonus sp. NC-CH8-MAG3]